MSESRRIRHAARELTLKERQVVEWLIANRKPEIPDFLAQVDSVKVIGGCPCGCPSLDFETDEDKSKKEVIVADVVGASPEGVLCSLILWSRGNQLSGVEVSSYAHTARSRCRSQKTSDVMRVGLILTPLLRTAQFV